MILAIGQHEEGLDFPIRIDFKELKQHLLIKIVNNVKCIVGLSTFRIIEEANWKFFESFLKKNNK